MRSRNIKPGFFKNEELAECRFETRILYIGLWSYGDREGRFEWRPKKIKAEIFPYDEVEIGNLLQELIEHQLLVKYLVNGKQYGYTPTFLKHQNPHPHEAASVLPAPAMACNDMQLQVKKGNADILNPDILNPDSKERTKPSAAPSSKHFKNVVTDLETKEIDRLCKTLGTQFKNNFHQWVQKSVNKGHRVEAIILALKGLWEHKKDVKKPWPYLNHILTVEHQNMNEREAMAQHEERKKEEIKFTGDETVKDMALGVTKNIQKEDD